MKFLEESLKNGFLVPVVADTELDGAHTNVKKTTTIISFFF